MSGTISRAAFERVRDNRDDLARQVEELRAERDELRARLDRLDTPHHVLILSDDRWTIEHALSCREGGRMAECVYHQDVADWIDRVGEPDLPKGRYVIGDGPLPGCLSPET